MKTILFLLCLTTTALAGIDFSPRYPFQELQASIEKLDEYIDRDMTMAQINEIETKIKEIIANTELSKEHSQAEWQRLTMILSTDVLKKLDEIRELIRKYQNQAEMAQEATKYHQTVNSMLEILSSEIARGAGFRAGSKMVR